MRGSARETWRRTESTSAEASSVPGPAAKALVMWAIYSYAYERWSALKILTPKQSLKSKEIRWNIHTLRIIRSLQKSPSSILRGILKNLPSRNLLDMQTFCASSTYLTSHTMGRVTEFLSDPGIPGIRSMGPSLWNSLRDLLKLYKLYKSYKL